MRLKTVVLLCVLLIVSVFTALSVGWYRDSLVEFPDEEEDISYQSVRVSVPPPGIVPAAVTETEEPKKAPERTLAEAVADVAAVNNEFFGYLVVPGTEISYPVVLGANNKYYLTHNYFKEESASGCLFVDVGTAENGYCLVIHGHNMGSGRADMFSPLIQYQVPEHYSDNRVFCLVDADGSIKTYRIFSVFNLETTEENAFQYRREEFADDFERQEFLHELVSRSMYDAGGEDIAYPELVILSTCNRQYGAGNRFLVCGGLVSEVS